MYFRFKIDLPSFASFAGVHFCFSLPENERALFTLLPPKSFPLSPGGEKFDREQIQIEIHHYTINRGKLYTTQRRTAFGSLKNPQLTKWHKTTMQLFLPELIVAFPSSKERFLRKDVR